MASLALASLLGAALLLQQPAPAPAAGVPAYTIFQGMLRFAEEGATDKLLRSVELLAPRLAEQERLLGPRDIAGEFARARTTAEQRSVVEVLVARNVAALLEAAGGEASAARRRTLVKTARLEWGLVEAAWVRGDQRRGFELAALFRDAGAAAQAEDGDGLRQVLAQLRMLLESMLDAAPRARE
jgi:hypothetical protein